MGWQGSAETFGKEADECAVIQGGVHPLCDMLKVIPGELAPVERGADVVCSVEAGIEE